jgi:hypothetical protein
MKHTILTSIICLLTTTMCGVHTAHADEDRGAQFGACCLNTGGCEMVKDEAQCIDYNGTYAGDGTSCDDKPPHCEEEVWGACCMGEECADLTDWECGNSGGSFYADVFCNEFFCLAPEAACCIGDECIVSTEADCDGEYMGDGTDCSVNYCVSDNGACCYGNGEFCAELPNSSGQGLCEDIFNGTWMGAGTSCGEINCLGGACCFVDLDQNSTCVDGYTEYDCKMAGGDHYYGDGSTCAAEGAECATYYGACCFDGTLCEDSVRQVDCEYSGGVFLGEDSTCADEGSTCTTGACCWEKFMDCSHTDYNDCESSGGTWLGHDSSCDIEGEYCDPGPYGACCYGDNCASTYQWECTYNGGSWIGGNCTDCTCTYCGTCCFGETCLEDVPNNDCESAGGIWMGNVSCTEELCAPPPPTGACCVESQCTVETEEDCSGLYLGDDMPCDGNPCGNDGGDGPFIGIAYDVLGTDLVTDSESTWTVDVYAVLAAGCRLDAIAGDINQSKMVSTTGSFYQHPFGGPTSQGINPALFPPYPDLEFDSFMTIGLSDQNGNALSDIGIDWTDFESGGAVNSTDGSWYVTPADAQGDSDSFQDQFCEDNNGVRIARLTVRGLDSIVFFEALFQGKDVDGVTWQDSELMAIAYDDCDPPTSCVGDINLDGTVDVLDLLQVIGNWGPCTSCPADIDGNAVVDVIDLLEVIANWGPCPEEACSDGWDCAIGDDIEDYACDDGGGTCTVVFPSDDTTLGGTGISFNIEGIGPLWRDDHSLTETFACAEPSINSLSLVIDIDNAMDDFGGTAMHTWDVRVNGTSVGQFSVITGQDEINESFSFSSVAHVGGDYVIQLQATNHVYSGGGSYHMAYTGSDDHSVELGNNSNCYCFGLEDGSNACVSLFSNDCLDYDPCSEDGECPPGYECVTTTCCPYPVCMPICE